MTRQRVLIGGKKYFPRPVFTNYAASRDGEIIIVKTQRIMKMQKTNSGYNKFQVSDKKTVFDVFK